ncbi:MAG TPA: L-threonylcarbamoyladenylate synthase [Candidatus Paceibacterota bacterium]
MEILRLEEVGVERAAKRAAEMLRKGKLVLYPTDTLYGLGADATNARALALLRELKGREKKKPLSVLVPDHASISRYAHLNDTARALAERFLPGALTLVLPATDRIPAEITLNGAIGIRIPDDSFSLALARAFGKPVTATSANKSGRETPATVEEVICQFGPDAHEIALAIDGGSRKGNIGSTVVSIVSDTPYVLREGAITRTALGI